MATQDYFHALVDVATVINSSLEPNIVLKKITEQTTRAMNCKASTIRLLDRTGKVLLASAAYGLSSGYMRKGPVEVAKSGMDSDVLAGKLIYLRNVSKDAGFQYPSNAKDEGLVSVLSAPLTVEGRPIGILRVYASEERDFSDEEKEFLKGVANISAIAIENARMTEALRCKYDLLTTYNYQIYED